VATASATWAERYEILRRYVVEGRQRLPAQPLGLALWLAKGMAGWMKQWGCLAEATAGPLKPVVRPQGPAGDASALNFSLDNHADLLVSDPKGLRTGISGARGMILEEIPDTAYLTMTLGNEETGDPSTAQTGHTVDIPTPVTGIYQVRVAGVESGQYTLGIRAFSQDGSPQPALTMPGVAALGSVSLFNIQFAPQPGAIAQVRRVASFQSTLADIDNSLRIGLIDNRGIANSLSQKVAAALDAVVRGERGAAANVLNAFRNEVLAQSGQTSGASAPAGQRHLFGVAPQVLLEDAQSLISQTR